MTNQELYYDILLKKYSVLKKNLIIIEQTDDKIEEFRNTIIKIDEIEQEKFKKEQEIKTELTTNLNDEYSRLYDYINLLEERNNRRASMLEDYNNIVKDKIDDLEKIEDYENIGFYKKRLEDISEYLNNEEKYNKSIEEKEEYLNIKSEYENKLNSLNKVLEEYELNLLIKLKETINNNEVYKNLDFDNINESISNYDDLLKEKERELITYLSSYKVLLNTELSEKEKEEYLNFVEELKREYKNLLEKKYILLLYKYINDNEKENALKVYDERIIKLKTFDIDEDIDLQKIYDIINNYMLKNEYLNEIKTTIESIQFNIEEVDDKINEIIKELNKPNIVSLLKEFCIEKDYIEYDNSDLYESETSQDLFVEDENTEENIKEKDIDIEIIEKNDEMIFDDIVDELGNDVEDQEKKFLEDINIIDNKEEADSAELTDTIDNVEEVKPTELIDIIDDKDENNNDIPILETDLQKESFDKKLIENDVYEEPKEIKGNIIKAVKEITELMLIDEIRRKSLIIMKSVCESII